jgi:ABC-type uncharacterized transport system substrate-binding protein
VLIPTLAFLCLVAPPGAAQSDKVFRVGILSNVPLSSPQGAPVWGAFVEGLRDLGYVEGENVTIVDRSSEGKYERLPELAAELVRLKVDVIVAPANQNVRAAQQASRTIPIVMAGASNPVEDGLVASRYVLCHDKRHPAEMGVELTAFLSSPAVDRRVAAAACARQPCEIGRRDWAARHCARTR